MRSLRALFFLFLFAAGASAPSFALAGAETLKEEEFRALAADLAPKVNLFHDAWEKDPTAEFYGGTTRDYLYWVKGQFREAKNREQALAKAAELKKLPAIDVRSFIIGDSDVDIFSAKAGNLKPEDYGVRKIDYQNPATLDPATELGKSELQQGYIPAEKIRLGKDGFRQEKVFGDGIREIFSGPLTVHFASPEEFAKSKYAKEGINHPILLALRYLRLQAIHYYQTHGQGFPTHAYLHAAIDPASAEAVREVVEKTLDGKELVPFLERPRFLSWLNGGMQKAFRSYTNPTAARELFREFRVDELPNVYAGKVDPVNQYVFAKFRDEAKIHAALNAAHVNRDAFFEPVAHFFPDGYLYHGTRTEPAFRSILFQGVIGSEGGSAGKGLYGVSETNREFSERWGGSKERLVRFPVRSEARIVDVTKGEGRRVFDSLGYGHDYEKFADEFGVDILRYPYDTEAFVVKNSAALGKPEGVHRQILPLSEILERAVGLTDPEELFRLIEMNNLTERESGLVLSVARLDADLVEEMARKGKKLDLLFRFGLPTLPIDRQLRLLRDFAGRLPIATSLYVAKTYLAKEPFRSDEDLVLHLLDVAQHKSINHFDVETLISALSKNVLSPTDAPALPRVVEKIIGNRLARSSDTAFLFAEPKYQDPKLFLAWLHTFPGMDRQLIQSLKTPGWERFPEVLEPFVANRNLFHYLSGMLAEPSPWDAEWPGKADFLEKWAARPDSTPDLLSYLRRGHPTPKAREIAERLLFTNPRASVGERVLAFVGEEGPWAGLRDDWVQRTLRDFADSIPAKELVTFNTLREAGKLNVTKDALQGILKDQMRSSAYYTLMANAIKLAVGSPLWDTEADQIAESRFVTFLEAAAQDEKAPGYLFGGASSDGSAMAKEYAHRWIAAGNHAHDAHLVTILKKVPDGSFMKVASRILSDARFRGGPVEAAAVDHAARMMAALVGGARDPAYWAEAIGLLQENPRLKADERIVSAVNSNRIHRVENSRDEAFENLLRAEVGDEPGPRVASAFKMIDAYEHKPGVARADSYYYLRELRDSLPADIAEGPAFFRTLLQDSPPEVQDRLVRSVLARFPSAEAEFVLYALAPDPELKEAVARIMGHHLSPGASRAALLRLESARDGQVAPFARELKLAEDAMEKGLWDDGHSRWLGRLLRKIHAAKPAPENVRIDVARLQAALSRWQGRGPESLRILLEEKAWLTMNEASVRGLSCPTKFGRL